MNVDRFIAAQDQPDGGYAEALAEIRGGAKRGHWIWYIFPQLYGLGTSSPSRAYGIRGIAEATEYLQNDVLRSRLIEVTQTVADQVRRGVALDTLMGSSIDVLKLVSSLTLFGGVAERLACDDPTGELDALAATSRDILAASACAGFPPCARTLQELQLAAEL